MSSNYRCYVVWTTDLRPEYGPYMHLDKPFELKIVKAVDVPEDDDKCCTFTSCLSSPTDTDFDGLTMLHEWLYCWYQIDLYVI